MTKQEKAKKLIDRLTIKAMLYLATVEYYKSKYIIDFIVEILDDSKNNNGISTDIIDKLTETNYDMTEFYQYVKEYNVKILTY